MNYQRSMMPFHAEAKPFYVINIFKQLFPRQYIYILFIIKNNNIILVFYLGKG
jgi:hypothetical protein